ncbi:hypothetical protein RRG08_016967 [Elysia crispata]|uniref:Uncharacterized protein n=1 Tax=Elysia crispata TaxID=231223 RepID=A0AAE0XZ87_9GAST|nr:hypothetical protein RRG08_016967 [Elysia crispata]
MSRDGEQTFNCRLAYWVEWQPCKLRSLDAGFYTPAAGRFICRAEEESFLSSLISWIKLAMSFGAVTRCRLCDDDDDDDNEQAAHVQCRKTSLRVT